MKVNRVYVVEKLHGYEWRPTNAMSGKKYLADRARLMALRPGIKLRVETYYRIPNPYLEKKWQEITARAAQLRREIDDLLNFDFSKQGSWKPMPRSVNEMKENHERTGNQSDGNKSHRRQTQ